jgi:hypothetical protein
MAVTTGKVHVARVTKTHRDKQGREHRYSSAYLRRSYREGDKVCNETVATLSMLPEHVIDLIEASLKGERFVSAGAVVSIARSLPHGHVAAVAAMARKLGMPALLGPPCRERDLALGLIVSRVVRPASKLSTLSWWGDVTLGEDLRLTAASTDEIYQAMDWLVDRQHSIEKKLAARHLAPAVNPSRMALFDLSSSWMEGACCPLAARGYSRDGKKGKPQIEYGILTDPAGRPVAVRVFAGNTGDPSAFIEIVEVVRDRFGLDKLVMVGDRGMITSARIDALREHPNNTLGWITALRAPAIKKLLTAGVLQPTLFDEQDLAEITHPDYPNQRLVACRNPFLATERARKRGELLDRTQALLDQIATRVATGNLTGADRIGLKVGEVLNKYRVGKHFEVHITDTSLAITRRQEQIDAEAAGDGIYMLRTDQPADELDSPGVVTGYKSLSRLERDFRHIKVDDLDLRPVYHRLEDRVKAHILICMLACYLLWHLRKAWAPLTFTDEDPPEPVNPVAPATRSRQAQTKAHYQHDQTGNPYRAFGDLLDHLGTLTRNQVRFTATNTHMPMLADPTPDQRRAFELINTAIPLTCT